MSHRRPLIIVVSILGAVVASMLLVLRYVGEDMHRTLDPVTDVAQYPSLLAGWKPSGLVNHFPATIPPSAQDVRFFARPGKMQGDFEIQLHLKLPPDEVAAIAASAQSIVGRIYPGGGDELDHVTPGSHQGWPTATFHTAANPSQSTFPQTYTFYVIKAVDQGMGTWDGCDVCGIAISASTHEVVYWAEWSGMPPAASRPSPARVATTRPGKDPKQGP